MRKLILLLVLFQSVQLFAQTEWFPLGAEWFYNRPSSASSDYVVFKSEKDSSIQGKNVRVIDVKLNGTNLVSREYIYQNGDTVFYYNTNSNTFHSLYNFSAKSGDIVTVHENKFKPNDSFFSYADSINNFIYRVVSVDSVQVSDKWVRRQKVEALNSGEWGFSKAKGEGYFILEGMGSDSYFFGVFGGIFLEENPSILRCYNDGALSYKSSSWSGECDSRTSGVLSNNINSNCLAFPNPFTNQLNVEMGNPIEFIEVFNEKGLKMLEAKPEGKKSVVLNTSFLDEGYYWLKITTKEISTVKKLLKVGRL